MILPVADRMLPDRYTLSNFRRALNQPEKFLEEIRRLPFTFHAVIQNAYATMQGYGESDAILVMDEDWDNLIVIDACRLDLFEEVVDTTQFDEYRRVVSVDSNTTPWSIKNFKDRQAGDTVYVTGNSAPSKTIPDEFHEFVEIWTDPEATDETSFTVPADVVTERTIEAAREYPDKRIISHYVQPHVPFVPRPDLIFRTYTSDADRLGLDVEDPEPPHTVWEAIEMGEVDREQAWEGYRENLEYAMEHVMELVENLKGRTVITSDHGNMLGERTVSGRRVYGHPGGMRTRALVEVPWAVVDDGERKKTRDDGVNSEGSMDSDIIDERLAALGYVDE
jgi:hypothetical protein